ncbi:hypothetical protein HOD08_03635 [bacterium]|nr:hypothetical protein [bacterium]
MNLKFKCTTVVTIAVLASTNYSGNHFENMRSIEAADFAVENIVHSWDRKVGRAIIKDIDWLVGENKKRVQRAILNYLLDAIMRISVYSLEPNLRENPNKEYWYITQKHSQKLLDLMEHLVKCKQKKKQPKLSEAEQRVLRQIPGLKYLSRLDSFPEKVRQAAHQNQPTDCTVCTIL